MTIVRYFVQPSADAHRFTMNFSMKTPVNQLFIKTTMVEEMEYIYHYEVIRLDSFERRLTEVVKT